MTKIAEQTYILCKSLRRAWLAPYSGFEEPIELRLANLRSSTYIQNTPQRRNKKGSSGSSQDTKQAIAWDTAADTSKGRQEVHLLQGESVLVICCFVVCEKEGF